MINKLEIKPIDFNNKLMIKANVFLNSTYIFLISKSLLVFYLRLRDHFVYSYSVIKSRLSHYLHYARRFGYCFNRKSNLIINASVLTVRQGCTIINTDKIPCNGPGWLVRCKYPIFHNKFDLFRTPNRNRIRTLYGLSKVRTRFDAVRSLWSNRRCVRLD